MSKYYLVDVKSITSKVARSSFKVDELEKIAQNILTSGGLLSPLLLKQTGIESYDVVAGDLEYYAAVRAKEINPRVAEMVNAFVVPKDLVETALEQFNTLHGLSKTEVVKKASSQPSGSNSEQITNLEARLDGFLNDIRQGQERDINRLEKKISALQEQLPSKVEPLIVFNTYSTAELLQKMNTAGVKGKTAEKIINGIEKAREKEAFVSFKDVIKRVNGLGETRMLTMLDAWGKMY